MTRFSLTALLALLLCAPARAQTIDQLEHIHGLAYGADGALRIATHTGLYRAADDGRVERISDLQDDLMSLAASESESDVLYASGHPAGGGNLGLLRSTDGGRSWETRSAGYGGPVDFHHLAVSPGDRQVLYGAHGGQLQTSRDAGLTWAPAGRVPDGLLSLAISPTDPERLYAATEMGLLRSPDAGATWRPAMLQRSPATLVRFAPDGRAMTFVLGRGLMVAEEPKLAWQTRFDGFGGQVPLVVALSRDANPEIALLTQYGHVLTSRDGGQRWNRLGRRERLLSDVERNGQRVYDEFCAACHGVNGVGENFALPVQGAENIVAPALDDTAHAWHHTDEQLAQTIRDGSPRTARMPPWGTVLADEEIRAVVAYMKSLWTAREIACQGPKHMNCPKGAGQ